MNGQENPTKNEKEEKKLMNESHDSSHKQQIYVSNLIRFFFFTMKMERNLWTQSTLKNSHVPIIGGAKNITTAIPSNGTNVEFNTTVELKEVTPVQSKGRHLLGPVLGGLGIFIVLVFYILGQRKEDRERKEKALQATRKEEMKRKFLKDQMNIKVSVSTILSIESKLFLCVYVFRFFTSHHSSDCLQYIRHT